MSERLKDAVESELEATQGDRYKCPFCKARRGITWDRDGDTGVIHCFGCHVGLSGAQFLAKLWEGATDDKTVGKILAKYDIDSDLDDVDRAERRARQRERESAAEKMLLRIERARDRMRPLEEKRYNALVEEARVTPHEEESDALREDIESIITTALTRSHFLDGFD